MNSSLPASLLAGVFVGGAAAYLGSLMITRRMALVGDALGHVALPGMGLAMLLSMDVSLGAFVFLAAGIYLIWRLGEKTVLSMETLVGIVFVSSLAAGFLILPEPELLESLIGDISKISLEGAAIATGVSVGVFFLVSRIYRGLMLMNISLDLASVEGIAPGRYNLLYLSAVALIVSIGVKVTGSLLVGALVIVPPASARIMGTNLRQYRSYSIGFGAISSAIGIILGRIFRFPAGPAIILTSTAGFALTLMIARARKPKPKPGACCR